MVHVLLHTDNNFIIWPVMLEMNEVVLGVWQHGHDV